MKLLLLFLSLVLASPAADIAGKWNVVAPSSDGGALRVQLIIQRTGDTYSGVIVADDGEAPVRDIQLRGPNLAFKIDTDDAAYEIAASVDGDSMKGTYSVNRQAGGHFTAKRESRGNSETR
jgi:hypothetical protein